MTPAVQGGLSLIDNDQTGSSPQGDFGQFICGTDDKARTDDNEEITLTGMPEGVLQVFLGKRIAKVYDTRNQLPPQEQASNPRDLATCDWHC